MTARVQGPSLLKLNWRYKIEGIGGAYGFAKSGAKIMEALDKRGVQFCDDADIALSYVGSDRFVRAGDAPANELPGYETYKLSNALGEALIYRKDSRIAPKEYLFTMYEADLLTPKFAEGLKQADAIICPCRHNAQVFKRYAGGRPVHVCRLGIDPELYRYRERQWPPTIASSRAEGAPISPDCHGASAPRNDRQVGQAALGSPATHLPGIMTTGEGACPTNMGALPPTLSPTKFRFLWLGSVSRRKGWDLVARAFQAAFRPSDPVEIVFKTTGPDHGERCIHPNVIYDDRVLSETALRDLYYSAHAFVFPTRGDAFGLPALEAMATGCLVIAPKIQGLMEFVSDRTALIVDYNWIDAEFGIRIKSPSCDPRDLVRQMRRAYNNYNALKRRSQAGAEYVQENLTWDHTARRLIEIIWGKQAESQGTLFEKRQGEIATSACGSSQ